MKHERLTLHTSGIFKYTGLCFKSNLNRARKVRAQVTFAGENRGRMRKYLGAQGQQTKLASEVGFLS